MVTDRTPEARRIVLERLRKLKSGPQFTPPSLEGTVIFPGFDGGGEWGGAAFDPESGLLYVNSNEMPGCSGLYLRAAHTGRPAAGCSITENCAACHREDSAAARPSSRPERHCGSRAEKEIAEVIRNGAGRMPSFRHLGESGLSAILQYRHEGRGRARIPKRRLHRWI